MVARAVGADGAEHLAVCAQIARTEAARRAGLAGVALGDGEVLVIEFPVVGEACIHNAPVGYAIDAAFVDGEGAVTRVLRGVPARDEALVCEPIVARVVEGPAGRLAAVEVGDLVTVGR
ncbi:MAG: DUF192 domain-containing protein [Myxococcales bacterium]|nr:DUF192 domain-containing protein [Myxococcales bacterium]MCB9732799.1 DUF192 domain-containing protein [Deltaproteobacteria bacterium]